MAKMNQILWAVVPSSEDRELETQAGRAVVSLTEASPCTVEIATIITPGQFLRHHKGIEDMLDQMSKEVELNMTRWVDFFQWKQKPSVKILREETFSVRAATKRLIKHAQKTSADLIVVSTHARKGVGRAILGSFAETLVLQSKIPVMVVNPKGSVSGRIQNILYPTDFTPQSEKMFKKVLELAQKLSAKVTLFHQIEYFTDFSAPSFVNAPMYAKYFEEDLEFKRLKAQKYVSLGKKMKVDVEVDLQKKSGYIIDGILKAAKSADLIAMVSQTGPVASVILGSVTRKILRESPCPIWVVHP